MSGFYASVISARARSRRRYNRPGNYAGLTHAQPPHRSTGAHCRAHPDAAGIRAGSQRPRPASWNGCATNRLPHSTASPARPPPCAAPSIFFLTAPFFRRPCSTIPSGSSTWPIRQPATASAHARSTPLSWQRRAAIRPRALPAQPADPHRPSRRPGRGFARRDHRKSFPTSPTPSSTSPTGGSAQTSWNGTASRVSRMAASADFPSFP